ncbi:phosphatase PAP2 family protein [Larkinella knui]|uniref:Phosphatase PAP2 family protein n=1 Tax=Larkinella knui TaxID=2025310 RepID=A0A3P1CK76_9BACT|nr:phosphatase PAP2 family protein [Larkinella knui]RRB13742.1 phosphatase PAP2 family protein [Larkinella knui]
MKQQRVQWFLIIFLSYTSLVQAQAPVNPADSTSAGRATPSELLAASTRPAFRPKAFILPAALMTAGLLTQGHLSRQVEREVVKQFPGFRSPVDNYLQFAPTVVMLGLGAAGVKGKHRFGDQLVLAVLANSVAQGITTTLKFAVSYPRPDQNGHQSFPSGHTTSAFTGATLLAHEYGGRSGWYSFAGYAAATTVGGFRIIKNRHWLADVLFGAGVGIASTEAVYQLYPWLKHLVVRRKQTVLLPVYQGSWGGVCLTSVF